MKVDLTDHKKSIMLARMMGWNVREFITNQVQVMFGDEEPKLFEVFDYVDEDGCVTEHYDFYAPANMALSFMAITWHVNDVMEYDPEWVQWWFETSLLPQVKAQRAWNDKALELDELRNK